MWEKIQPEGGGAKPRQKIMLGVISNDQTANISGAFCLDSENKDEGRLQATGRTSADGTDVQKSRFTGQWRKFFSPVGLSIIMIKGYQLSIARCLPGCCRFAPTCSHYALEAFQVHGFFKGLALTVWRLLRCQPFSKGGFDPVPELKKGK
ncbi:MAG: membrane protein insertion efficiency factor YidD [Victivallaceae bacterium]|nr:membrane protein insertion efficiency factor YidD [Victivallaceae bacterium]